MQETTRSRWPGEVWDWSREYNGYKGRVCEVDRTRFSFNLLGGTRRFLNASSQFVEQKRIFVIIAKSHDTRVPLRVAQIYRSIHLVMQGAQGSDRHECARHISSVHVSCISGRSSRSQIKSQPCNSSYCLSIQPSFFHPLISLIPSNPRKPPPRPR